VTLRDVVLAGIQLRYLESSMRQGDLACFTGLMNQEGGVFLTQGDNSSRAGSTMSLNCMRSSGRADDSGPLPCANN